MIQLLLLHVLVHLNENFSQLTRTSTSWQLQFLEGNGQQHAPCGDEEQEAPSVNEKQKIADGDGEQKIPDVDSERKIPDGDGQQRIPGGNGQLKYGPEYGQPPYPISTEKRKHVHWVRFQAISAKKFEFY